MTRLSFTATYVATVLGVFLLSFAVTHADNRPKKPKSITVADLANREVIGYLGLPLGTVITVEGVIANGSYTNAKADAGRILLRIDTVNGEKMPKEHVYQLSNNDKPKVGSKFKYIGYETGGFIGIPAKAFDYGPRVATTDYGFQTEFWVLHNELKKE